MKNLFILLTFVTFSFMLASGQDIRGGELSYQHKTGNTFEFEVYLYTQTSLGIQHDSIYVQPGTKIGGSASNLPNDITEWYYKWQQTFPGMGSYIIVVTDSFRIEDIQNINTSSGEGIHLQAELIVDPGMGTNSAPQLMHKQLDVSSDGNYFYHSVNAFDSDGDSLFYELVPASASNYILPAGAVIDPYTGSFQMPVLTGSYAVNIKLTEYRQGRRMGFTHREMIFDSKEIIGIDEAKLDSDRGKIYPNPVKNKLTIENQTAIDKVTLHSFRGQKLLNLTELNQMKTEVTTEALPKGTYILEITDVNGQSWIRRIVK